MRPCVGTGQPGTARAGNIARVRGAGCGEGDAKRTNDTDYNVVPTSE